MIRRRGSSIVTDNHANVPTLPRTDFDVSMSSTSSLPFPQANTLIIKMLNFMSRIAPGSKYSKLRSDKRKKRKMMKYVHTELSSIWRNCEELFQRSVKSEVELNIFPQVDWSKVNSRMIKNVPAPFTHPVHGVSDNPEFYEVDEKKDYTTSKFHLSFPFGYKWGYETNCGIIATGCDQVLHGYAWLEDERRFILATEFPNKRKNAWLGSVSLSLILIYHLCFYQTNK